MRSKKEILDLMSFILLRYRHHHRITQKELAYRVKMPQGHISKIEHSRLTPAVTLWLQICDYLQISLSLLQRETKDLIDQEIAKTVVKKSEEV